MTVSNTYFVYYNSLSACCECLKTFTTLKYLVDFIRELRDNPDCDSYKIEVTRVFTDKIETWHR